MPLPVIPILTTAGRFALPYLQRELVKQGTKKFIKDHGKEALTAVTGGVVLNRIMDDNIDPSITQSVAESPEGLVIGGEPKETLPPPPPLVTPEPEKIDTKLETPIDQGIKSEPLITPEPKKIDTTLTTPVADTPKKEDFILTKDKAETGSLTDVEVQTAKSLKGETADYYSKIVKGMEDFSQPIASKEQLKNYIKNLKATEAETNYLGIDNLIDSYQGDKVDITKFKKALAKRDISSTIRSEEIPQGLSLRGDKGGPSHYETFESFSLPGALENRSILLIKFDRPPGEEKYFPPGTHFNPVISADTIAHVRGQKGYADPELLKRLSLSVYDTSFSKEEQEAIIKLKDTFIIDEIQSDYLQDQREKGFISDYKILTGDNEVINFLENKNIDYTIAENRGTKVARFNQKNMQVNLDDRIMAASKGKGVDVDREIPIGPGYSHIFFKGNYLHSVAKQDYNNPYHNSRGGSLDLKLYGNQSVLIRGKRTRDFPTKQSVEERTKQYIKNVYKPVPNLPIVKTEKWVDLAIDAAIKKAIDKNVDSIAFTNGNIQTNRYQGMGSEEQQGMKYFYDNIVRKKFDKLAKKYGVEIEEINLKSTQFQELNKQYQYAETNASAVLTKLSAKELLAKLRTGPAQRELPDYFNIFLGVPKYNDPKVLRPEIIKQDSIIQLLQNQVNIMKSYEDPQPMSETQELLRDSVEKKVGSYGPESEYLVWTIGSGKEIYLGLPAVQVKLSNYAKSGAEGFADEGLRDVALKGVVVDNESSKYINDYDAVLINEEIEDTARNEVIYKMPLPKELQKEILSKPKKMSKLQGQSNRLFA